jgi:hypothetical protein
MSRVFGTSISISIGTLMLLFLELVSLTLAYVAATYAVLAVDPMAYLLYEGGLAAIAPAVLAVVVAMHIMDPRCSRMGALVRMQQICFAMGMAFLVSGLASYLLHLRMPLMVMLAGSLLAGVALFVVRTAMARAWHDGEASGQMVGNG